MKNIQKTFQTFANSLKENTEEFYVSFEIYSGF